MDGPNRDGQRVDAAFLDHSLGFFGRGFLHTPSMTFTAELTELRLDRSPHRMRDFGNIGRALECSPPVVNARHHTLPNSNRAGGYEGSSDRYPYDLDGRTPELLLVRSRSAAV